MAGFKEISTRDVALNPFRAIGDDWMLIAAGDAAKANAMTASWGGLGVLWGADAATVYVRHSRYTKEFLDAQDSFSLSFFDHAQYARQLGYLGSVSGRNEDKIEKSGLALAHDGGVPYFDGARTVFICKKVLHQPIDAANIPADIRAKFYADGDWHDLYIGRIVKVLAK